MNHAEYAEDLRRHSALATELAVRRMKLRARPDRPSVVGFVRPSAVYDVRLQVRVRLEKFPSADRVSAAVAEALCALPGVTRVYMDWVRPADPGAENAEARPCR